ncbi:hypothetical protein [Candidatus Odyssella thessalonicensis]|uniref:hypothetical protein n=1 Tax=Candidatus Odyssella thessalonicensis TaxID=84647 RepID=UPI000225B789|nr:hypothetical protein [Candidatus Odyssella thessalonicensis]
MNGINRKTILKTLEGYVTSWPKQKLVFSYTLAYRVNLSDSVLVLEQIQTRLALTLSVRFINGYLQINSFDLKTDNQLEASCQTLYDVALIELVIQALDVIYYCAELSNSPEATLLLSKEEAEHLSGFKDFFSTVSSQMTPTGKRIVLELPTWDNYYQYFKSETGIILTQMYQKMWRDQKTEPLIKQYLKDWPSLTPLDLESPLITSLQSEKLGNLIKLPLVSKQAI